MTSTAPERGYDLRSYFSLSECGLISEDDRVELFDGMIVSMAPPSPLHDAVVHHVQAVLLERLPQGTLVRAQMTLVTGPASAPQPDVAVVPGRNSDYLHRHPSEAHLVIEVADSSLVQDRLTKAVLYARAAIADYWIVNLKDGCVECFADPDPAAATYRRQERRRGGARLPIAAFAGVELSAAELFPSAAH